MKKEYKKPFILIVKEIEPQNKILIDSLKVDPDPNEEVNDGWVKEETMDDQIWESASNYNVWNNNW